jgi:hypothetical protein
MGSSNYPLLIVNVFCCPCRTQHRVQSFGLKGRLRRRWVLAGTEGSTVVRARNRVQRLDSQGMIQALVCDSTNFLCTVFTFGQLIVNADVSSPREDKEMRSSESRSWPQISQISSMEIKSRILSVLHYPFYYG